MSVVLVLSFAFLLTQPSPCAGDAAALAGAAARAEAFDLSGAAARLEAAARSGCADTEMAALYLRGLLAARRAYGEGGDAASLRPVNDIMTRLESGPSRASAPADIARLVLRAAASAAQSEREEMAVFLEHATRTEALQLATGQPGAPILTAHEAAGDLWLQVHRYDQAQLAYTAAVEQVGASARLALGLARVAVRLKNTALACAEYRTVLERWGQRPGRPPEIAEARAFGRRSACRQQEPSRRPR